MRLVLRIATALLCLFFAVLFLSACFRLDDTTDELPSQPGFPVMLRSHGQRWASLEKCVQIFSQRFSFILTCLSSLGHLLVPSGGLDTHSFC